MTRKMLILFLAALLTLSGCGSSVPPQEEAKEPEVVFPISVESPRLWTGMDSMMNLYKVEYNDGDCYVSYRLPAEYEATKNILLHYAEDYLEETIGLTRDNFEEKEIDETSSAWLYYSYPGAQNYAGYSHSFMVGCGESGTEGYTSLTVYSSSSFDLELSEAAKPRGNLPMTLGSPMTWLAEDVNMELAEQKPVETSTRYDYIVPLDLESTIELVNKYSEEYLQKEKGLHLSYIDDTHEEEEGRYACFYFYPEAESYYSSEGEQEDSCMFVGCFRRTDDTTWITWVHSSSFMEETAQPEPVPTPAPAPIPTPTPTPAGQQPPAVDKQFQSPAMWLKPNSVFTVNKRMETSYGSFFQFYEMSLPYEKSSEMLAYYVEEYLLKSEGFTLMDEYELEVGGDTSYTYVFDHATAAPIGGNEYVMILNVREDGSKSAVSVECSADLTMQEVSAGSTPTPTPAPAADPKVLPSFLKTGTDYAVSNSTTERLKVYTREDMDISDVETYVQQLKDMGYTIVHTEVDSFQGEYRQWEFAHSDLDVRPISAYGAHVIVKSNTYTTWHDQTLSIEFSAGITMNGESELPSSSSSGGGWVDCPRCYNGDCSACGGSGGDYSYSPGLPREWNECWKCHGDGDCDKCDGFGKILG